MGLLKTEHSKYNKLFDFKIELQNQQSKILQRIYWFRIPKQFEIF